MPRSHRATDVGSNRTQVPIRNDGIRPAFACLKIVILETVNILASSSPVNARPILSIRSGSDIGSVGLFWGLHDCIYLLCGLTCGNCRILLPDCAACNPCAIAQGLSPERAHKGYTTHLSFGFTADLFLFIKLANGEMMLLYKQSSAPQLCINTF